MQFFGTSMNISVRVAQMMLVKLTVAVNFTNIFCTRFVRTSFRQHFSSYVWLGAKILYEKNARKTLMKLTLGCLQRPAVDQQCGEDEELGALEQRSDHGLRRQCLTRASTCLVSSTGTQALSNLD